MGLSNSQRTDQMSVSLSLVSDDTTTDNRKDETLDLERNKLSGILQLSMLAVVVIPNS